MDEKELLSKQTFIDLLSKNEFDKNGKVIKKGKPYIKELEK